MQCNPAPCCVLQSSAMDDLSSCCVLQDMPTSRPKPERLTRKEAAKAEAAAVAAAAADADPADGGMTADAVVGAAAAQEPEQVGVISAIAPNA